MHGTRNREEEETIEELINYNLKILGIIETEERKRYVVGFKYSPLSYKKD